jgi:hypothetical protein
VTAGTLAGAGAAAGRPAADPRDAQIARLTKEKARLEQELARVRFVVDVQSNFRRSWRRSPRERTHRRVELVTDQAIAMLAPRIGTRAACATPVVAQVSRRPDDISAQLGWSLLP